MNRKKALSIALVFSTWSFFAFMVRWSGWQIQGPSLHGEVHAAHPSTGGKDGSHTGGKDGGHTGGKDGGHTEGGKGGGGTSHPRALTDYQRLLNAASAAAVQGRYSIAREKYRSAIFLLREEIRFVEGEIAKLPSQDRKIPVRVH